MLENRACVNSLPAPKKRVPRQHHFIVYIYLLCWTQSYPALDHKDGGLGPKAGKELSPHSPPPLVTPGCLLRTSTGGAEGKHPKRREFCLSPTHKHNRLCMHAHTVNHTHAYTHIHTHTPAQLLKKLRTIFSIKHQKLSWTQKQPGPGFIRNKLHH